jgi:hypothetical protein
MTGCPNIEAQTALAFQGRLVDIQQESKIEAFGSLMKKIGFTGPAQKYARACKFDTAWTRTRPNL